ncbi:MAG: DUF4956 domain-containing protein [Gemmatimonadetes bacterium]|nr:DUF4956 domain-containing protein [Gemmatimonadota bacterium]
MLLIIGYYIVVGAAAIALASWVPGVENAFTLSRLRELSSGLQGLEGGTGIDPGLAPWDRYGLGAVAASTLGALLVMIPVAWTYIVIRGRGDYDQALVHTLLILPVAVSGIVIIVQNSLALAFSLAGIVAAVRFRTTLEDTKDAVYVFLAIGVGLAAGVHALGIAAILGGAFNAINLVLWRVGFGNIYADQRRRTRALGLGDALAGPGSRDAAISVGDQRLIDAMQPTELREVAERMARMEQYLDAETETGKERKQFMVLLVHADSVESAQQAIELALGVLAVRWRMAEILPGPGNVSVLEYLVRLKDGISGGALLDGIRKSGGSAVRAAELRSLAGLRRRS